VGKVPKACHGGLPEKEWLETGLVVMFIIPAPGGRGRRTASSSPAWATYPDPVSKDQKQNKQTEKEWSERKESQGVVTKAREQIRGAKLPITFPAGVTGRQEVHFAYYSFKYTFRYSISFLLLFWVVLMVLGFELRASHLLASCLPLEPLHQSFYVLIIFEIGSRELFAQVGFEPRSS
jgi:hypothetical protein